MDRLSALFAQFTPSARVFHAGRLCHHETFDAEDGVGHLHVLRSGALTVRLDGGATVVLEQPSVLFYPRPCTHHLEPDASRGAELFCGSVDLGHAERNPLVQALPPSLLLPLGALGGLKASLELLFAEGLAAHCGRQAALDRLMEYVLILLLRHLLDSGRQTPGLLGALADPRLARAVTAMHEHPARQWTLELLAQEAGMSRARFALLFRQRVGTTPLDYLTGWRIGLAQSLLAQGRSVKTVARAVGYQSQATLSRVFTQRLGLSPMQWTRRVRAPEAATGRGNRDRAVGLLGL